MGPSPICAEAVKSGLRLLVILTLAGAEIGRAAGPAAGAAGTPIEVEVDSALLIELPEAASTLFVANPEVADIQVPGLPNARKFIVFGKAVGDTTVYAVSKSGLVSHYGVTVHRQTQKIASALRREVPAARIAVSGAPRGISVSGTADSPRDAQRLKATASQYLEEKDSLNFKVAVAAATQVNLRVRIAEVSRSTDKAFGFNWGAISTSGTIALGLLTGRAPLVTTTNAVTGASSTSFADFSRSGSPDNFDSIGLGYRNRSGTVNVSGLIDALAKEGLVTVLAEPNLTAISGETANFLAGGEFPVPVPQGLQQITIEWKKFGVSVDFTPIVLDANRLSIKVRPEVSELTSTGSVVINGTTIPALAVRRAETTVELASGQSFAIAGLFMNNASNQIRRIPWLGDIPVLGALFRSTRFQRNESELVIIVTPYIVQPVALAGDLRLPTDDIVFAGDLERVLLGRQTSTHPARPTPHLHGDAGFILER